MRFQRSRRLLAAFAMAALSFTGLHVSAQTAGDASLVFPQLTLVSGRKLKQAVVRSYDAKSEKLLIVAEGKAMVIPLAEVPTSLHERITTLAPSSGGTVNTVAGKAPAASNQPTRLAPPVVPRDASVGRPPPAADPSEANRRLLGQHRQAAQKRAERYYAFEYQLGSNAGKVTALAFDLSPPKAVPGWDGRYETEGKAYLEFFDAKGRSFRRITSTFEVVTEQKPGEELQVVTLNVKS